MTAIDTDFKGYKKEFKSLSEKIDGYDPATQLVVRPDIKEFIKIIEGNFKEILFQEDYQRCLIIIEKAAGPKLITKS